MLRKVARPNKKRPRVRVAVALRVRKRARPRRSILNCLLPFRSQHRKSVPRMTLAFRERAVVVALFPVRLQNRRPLPWICQPRPVTKKRRVLPHLRSTLRLLFPIVMIPRLAIVPVVIAKGAAVDVDVRDVVNAVSVMNAWSVASVASQPRPPKRILHRLRASWTFKKTTHSFVPPDTCPDPTMFMSPSAMSAAGDCVPVTLSQVRFVHPVKASVSARSTTRWFALTQSMV